MLMWKTIARLVLRYGYLWLFIILGLTVFLGWEASQVKLSYEFSKAIPTDHPKYIAYQQFRKKFGEDGNLLVIGIQSDKIFQKDLFNDYVKLIHDLKKTQYVEDAISMPGAINLVRSADAEKLQAASCMLQAWSFYFVGLLFVRLLTQALLFRVKLEARS